MLSSVESRQASLLKILASIDDFTVVCLVAWPLNENEAGVDLVLIETYCFSYANSY